jgi:hypothetical protein
VRKALLGLVVLVLASVMGGFLWANAAPAPPTVVLFNNPAISGTVNALAIGSGRLFVGGAFTGPFTNLGALNPTTGAVDAAWSPPAVPSQVRVLTTVGTRLFAGGDFGVRVYDTASGAQLASIACNSVRALEPDATNTWMVVGGNFGTCGGQTHRNLARMSVAGLTVDASWSPSANARVLAMAADSSGIFVGGDFTSLTSGTTTVNRFKLGKVANNGTIDPWNSPYEPNSGDIGTAKSVRAMDLAGGRLFASWGESVNKTVIYNQATAAFFAQWVSDVDTQVVTATGGNVYVGGHWFRYMGLNSNSAATYFAAFDDSSLAKATVVTPIPSGWPLGVFAIIPDGSGGLWLGGDVGGNWGPSAVKVRRIVHLTYGSNPPPSTTTTSSTTSTTTTTTTTPPSGGCSSPPDSKVTSPAVGATVGSSSTFAGTACDDTSVTRVRMAIRNASTSQWLQSPSGGFGSTFVQFDATLTAPNAASTNWSWAVQNLPAGSYYVQSKAVDNSGTVETTTPWVAFSVS